MRIHLFHLKPTSLLRIFFLLICGLRLTGWNPFRLRRFIPGGINSMMAAWNACQLLRSRPPPRTIIDVGANESQMTQLLLLQWRHEIKVLSFEPNPDLHPMGERFNLALGDHDGDGQFLIPPDSGWAHLVQAGEEVRRGASDRVVPVSVRRFDSLVKEGLVRWSELPRPILLKVDTEGHELECLKGFGERLGEIDYVLTEVGTNPPLDFTAFPLLGQLMREQGLKHLYIVHSGSQGSSIPGYLDVLFSRP